MGCFELKSQCVQQAAVKKPAMVRARSGAVSAAVMFLCHCNRKGAVVCVGVCVCVCVLERGKVNERSQHILSNGITTSLRIWKGTRDSVPSHVEFTASTQSHLSHVRALLRKHNGQRWHIRKHVMPLHHYFICLALHHEYGSLYKGY